MTEKIDLIKWLASLGVKAETAKNGIISLFVEKGQFMPVIQSLYTNGFNYLATITAVDLMDNRYELIYNLYSFESNQRIFLRVECSYDEKMPTVLELWPNARFYEREIYEMFGIEFTGNPDYKRPFIFEGNDPVRLEFPMRKSFDSIKFSLENYGERDYGGRKKG